MSLVKEEIVNSDNTTAAAIIIGCDTIGDAIDHLSDKMAMLAERLDDVAASLRKLK